MTIIHIVYQANRFLLGFGVLAALGYWGTQSGRGIFNQAYLTIGTPLLATIIWAVAGAVDAPLRLTGVGRFFLEFLLIFLY